MNQDDERENVLDALDFQTPPAQIAAEDPVVAAVAAYDDNGGFTFTDEPPAADDTFVSPDKFEAIGTDDYVPAQMPAANDFEAESPPAIASDREDPVASAANNQDMALPAGSHREQAIQLASEVDNDRLLNIAGTELQREQDNRKEMLGEATVVTLAPGTQLEIVGLGMTEVQQGRADVEI